MDAPTVRCEEFVELSWLAGRGCNQVAGVKSGLGEGAAQAT
jgi:hypothetical protein